MMQASEEKKNESVGLDLLLDGRGREAGFYVAAGPHVLLLRLLEGVGDLLVSDAQKRVSDYLKGEFHQFAIRSVLWIDSGNSFDPHYIEQKCENAGVDARRIFRGINVSRLFHASQFRHTFDRVPAPTSLLIKRDSEEGELREAVVHFRPLVIISDLLGLFYDRQLQDRDAERLLEAFLIKITALKKKALILGVLPPHEVPYNRRHFLSRLLDLAHPVTLSSQLRQKWLTADLPAAANGGW